MRAWALAALRSCWLVAALGTLVVVMALFLSGAGFEDEVVVALTTLIAVVGLYVFTGNSGVLSFGHIAFMAIGAYGSALLSMSTETKAILLPDLFGVLADAELPMALAALVAAAFAAALAYVVAIPLMRLSGIAASIATLSLLVIVNVVLTNWKAVTGAGGTLTAVPTGTTVDDAVGVAVGAILLAYVFQRSRIGMRLRASREDHVAARSVGIAVESERRLAFALSAFIVALAGALYAHFIGAISPDAFFLKLTFLTIAMLVIGGLHSLSGAVIGSIVISLAYEFFTALEAGDSVGPISFTIRPGLREVLIAALMLVILARRPEGLMAGRELRAPTLPRGPGALRRAAASLDTR